MWTIPVDCRPCATKARVRFEFGKFNFATGFHSCRLYVFCISTTIFNAISVSGASILQATSSSESCTDAEGAAAEQPPRYVQLGFRTQKKSGPSTIARCTTAHQRRLHGPMCSGSFPRMGDIAPCYTTGSTAGLHGLRKVRRRPAEKR